VNGKRSTIPSRRLQPGDVVALGPRSRDLAAFLGPLENARPLAHLSLDKDKRSVRVNEVPEREQIPVICEISLVVEYYSR
jgi:small subunit ribosomal protein S4